MRSIKRQEGMTAVGWLIVLALIGFFTLLALRMVPSYLEYYKIAQTLETIEAEGALDTPAAIRRLLERRFDISYVHSITPRDVSIKSAGGNWDVTAKYDSRVHLFANVDVIMSFNKKVQVSKF
jgi:Tfp pilus assembly protein PilE